uniref:Uncharacterized protein n=1 Tax=Romanomermis culicivorax TaxID=13658 RepID=A0A915J0L1_ROMCU
MRVLKKLNNREQRGDANSPNAFINNNADTVLSYVEDASGFTVVEFVRHTFVERAISLKYKLAKLNFNSTATYVDLKLGEK